VSNINSYAWYLQAIPIASTSHFVTLFSAHGDIVVGFAIFHIVYSKKKKKKKEKGTPPWYVNVGGHPMESVSHGL
jgi:hypothetical protein